MTAQSDIITVEVTRSELAGLIACAQYALGKKAHPVHGEVLVRGTLRVPTDDEQQALREQYMAVLVRLVEAYDSSQFVVDPSRVIEA